MDSTLMRPAGHLVGLSISRAQGKLDLVEVWMFLALCTSGSIIFAKRSFAAVTIGRAKRLMTTLEDEIVDPL